MHSQVQGHNKEAFCLLVRQMKQVGKRQGTRVTFPMLRRWPGANGKAIKKPNRSGGNRACWCKRQGEWLGAFFLKPNDQIAAFHRAVVSDPETVAAFNSCAVDR